MVVSAEFGFAETREPIPAVARQKDIAKLVAETYNLSKLDSTAKKKDAVASLNLALHEENLEADERYVVLTTLIALAKDVGDFEAWSVAVTSLTGSFDVDSEPEKKRLLIEYLNANKSIQALTPAVAETIATAQLAASENRYTDANGLLSAGDTSVRRLTGASTLKKQLGEAREEISAREKGWKVFQAANEKLKASPDDPAANFGVGRWHATQQTDWKTALPFLLKGSDAKWKSAAELENTVSNDGMAQMTVADSWWELGQKESGAIKSAVLIHAGYWYEQAHPNVISALKQQLITKRLDEIAPLKDSGSRLPAASASPTSANVGDWVDLLEWTEGADWTGLGVKSTDWADLTVNWNTHLEGNPTKRGIKLKRRDNAHFPLSAIIDGDYELEVEFTRYEGIGEVAVYFPVGIHVMRILLGSVNGEFSQVQFINGIGGGRYHRPGPISNNQRHQVKVRVRHNGHKASFEIDFDQTQNYLSWEGDYSELTDVDPSNWKTSMIQRVWIGGAGNSLEFHKVRVRMQSGTITRDSTSSAVRQQDMADGFVRLVALKPTASTAHFERLSVNQFSRGDLTTARWPRITPDFRFCEDYCGAYAPCRLQCPIPSGAKSFSVVAYNCSSGTTKHQIVVDGKPIYDSKTTSIAVIKVDLPGNASLLELVGDPDGDPSYDQIYWCFPRYHSGGAEHVTDKMVDGKTKDLKFQVKSNSAGGQKFTVNQPLDSTGPVHFRDATPCHEFIFGHAPSSLKYAVPAGFTRFSAIGLNPVSNSVKYSLLVGGKKIYESPQAGITRINAPLPRGTLEIELRIDHLGSEAADHSFWCYPRLHRK